MEPFRGPNEGSIENLFRGSIEPFGGFNREPFWGGRRIQTTVLKLPLTDGIFKTQGAAKGGRQKEFDHFFCFRDSFGHL